MPIPAIERSISGNTKATLALFGVVLFFVVVCGSFFFTHCLILTAPGHVRQRINMTGENLTNDMVIAPSSKYKGPQKDLINAGWQYVNPYSTDITAQIPMIEIAHDKDGNLQVGVRIRKDGKPLPPGEMLAMKEDEKGVVPQVLTPGRYVNNWWEYDMIIVPMIKIDPGKVGVVTQLYGPMAKDPNAFVVQKGERGTQADLLMPGTYPEYSNPFMYQVTIVDTVSQKFDLMGGANRIEFNSMDGFTVFVEGTIEWAPDLAKLPEMLIKYVEREDLKKSGGINNIQTKLVLPLARSLFRVEGGRFNAVDFITGNTRQVVQDQVEKMLREICAKEGAIIKSVVIRSTEPPQRIRQQFERRELAKRQKERYLKEIETEIGTPVLNSDGTPKLDEEGKEVREGGRLKSVIQEQMKERNTQLGEIRAAIAKKIQEAKLYEAVHLTEANQELEVSRFNLQAAADKGASIVAEGKAKADAKMMGYQAEADAIKEQIRGFENGQNYAAFLLSQKLAPAITRIQSNTDGAFADLFGRFTGVRPPNQPKQ